MAGEKFTHSKKYSDRCLHDMATMVLNQINTGAGDGIQCMMAMSQIMNMHPQQVVDRLNELANANV